MSYTPSFWEKTSFFRPWDVIVIGAGIVGLSAAYYFKKEHPESRVMILEKGFIPQGASTRNAGFACFGSVTEIMDDLQHESEEDVKHRIKARYDGLRLLRSTLGDKSIEYSPCMGYEIFDSGPLFHSAIERINRFNIWLKELTGQKEVYKATKINGYAAISNRLEGALHSGKMMNALIRKVEDEGAQIRWNSNVTAYRENTVVVNNDISLNADKILFATNGFTSGLLPECQIKPARGFIFITKELKDCRWKGTYHYDRGFVYFRNVGSRLLIGGGRNLDFETEETTVFEINQKIRQWLIKFADSVLKLEKGWEIDHEWTGIMGFASSKTPVIKKTDDHVYVAAGLGGMGVAIGMQIGHDASAMLSA